MSALSVLQTRLSGFHITNDMLGYGSDAQLKRNIGWLAIGAVVFFVLAQFVGGQIWDERIHRRGFEELRGYAQAVLGPGDAPGFETLTMDIEYYGILTTGFTDWVMGIFTGLFGVEGTASDELYRFLLHMNGFMWAMGSAFVTFRIMRVLGSGYKASAAAGVFLMAYPVWLGHSFFNFKDLAFAFFYILGLYGALLAQSEDREEFAKGLKIAAAAFVGAGLIKLVGIPVMMVQGAALLVAIGRPRERWARVKYAAMVGAVALALLYALTPVAWLDPIGFTVSAIDYMSHHKWGQCVTSAGECLRPTGPDWSAFDYLRRWVSVRLPLALLWLALPALFLCARARRLDLGIVVGALLIPLGIIVARQSALYDGLRHLLFAIPVLVVIVFYAVDKLTPHRWHMRQAAMGLLALSGMSFAADNLTLFPYNYVYFNEASRHEARPDRYELDYWGFSLRAAAGKMTADKPDPQAVMYYNAHPHLLVQPFVTGPFVLMDQYAPQTAPAGFYDISYTRWNNQPLKHCRLVGAVTRKPFLFGRDMVLSHTSYCEAGPTRKQAYDAGTLFD